MLQFITNYRIPLLVYTILLIIGTLFLIVWGKADIHIFINRHHSQFFDFFFKYFTHLGDGALIAIMVVLFLFIRYRYSLVQLIAGFTTAFTVQFMKLVLFPDAPRPATFFENEYTLRFVEGVTIHKWLSFPSGHTAAAFVVFITLMVTTRNTYLQLLYLLIAVLVGYSRMYLSLHFLPDVLVGSIIGTLIGLMAWLILGNSKKNWLDKRIHF